MPNARHRPYKMYCYKDRNHRILQCSQATVECAGYKNANKIIGLTDFDLPWQQYAETYHQHEEEIFNGDSYSTLIPLKDHAGNNNVFLHTKYCEYDKNGKFTRLACHATELINPLFHELTHLLTESQPETTKNSVFCLGKTISPATFSPRQRECLFFLLRGKSAEQIAKILQLSKRTIETYIEAIKEKLNCKTKAEIYAEAIERGYLNIIPSNLLLQRILAGIKYE